MSLDHLAVAVQGVGFRHESCAVQGFYTLEELIHGIIALASTLSMTLTPLEITRLRLRGVNVFLRFFPNSVELRLRET